MIYTCYHGGGYRVGSGVEQGFINVASQLDSLIDDPPHVKLADEQVDEHVIGVILASHFFLKKGINMGI